MELHHANTGAKSERISPQLSIKVKKENKLEIINDPMKLDHVKSTFSQKSDGS